MKAPLPPPPFFFCYHTTWLTLRYKQKGGKGGGRKMARHDQKSTDHEDAAIGELFFLAWSAATLCAHSLGNLGGQRPRTRSEQFYYIKRQLICPSPLPCICTLMVGKVLCPHPHHHHKRCRRPHHQECFRAIIRKQFLSSCFRAR